MLRLEESSPKSGGDRYGRRSSPGATATMNREMLLTRRTATRFQITARGRVAHAGEPCPSSDVNPARVAFLLFKVRRGFG